MSAPPEIRQAAAHLNRWWWTRTRLWHGLRRRWFNVNYFSGYHEGWENCATGMLHRLVEMGYLTDAQEHELWKTWGI